MDYLITGASGFLGGIIKDILLPNNRVDTLGRNSSNDIVVDLSKKKPNINIRYNEVIHCAGKAHETPKNKFDELEFYNVNLQGTLNLLESLNDFLPERFVFISTVAVYGRETGENIDESHELLGTSPYAKSKIEAEKVIINWGKVNHIPVLILRLPLIAGTNPPGNLGKMINGIKSGKYLSINHGKARRSVVSASDVANLISSSSSYKGVYNLSDGLHPTFKEIELTICKILEKKSPPSIPKWLAILIGYIGNFIPNSPVNLDIINKMTSNLTFDDIKARNELNWNPNNAIKQLSIY
ncbi:MAG: NAD-dependent epimerase/dehydratase family protein [Cyclobacteriaceae bacterium]